MLRPFDLDPDMLEHLRGIAEWPGSAEFVHRPGSAHARAGEGAWAMVVRSPATGHAMTLATGRSEEELRERLAGQLAALSERAALEELGVPNYRYAGLMAAVRAAADDMGLDVAEVPGVEFVRAWLEHSETSAAGWLAEDSEPEALRSIVGRVVRAHVPATGAAP